MTYPDQSTNYATRHVNSDIFENFNLEDWGLENSSLDYLSEVLRKHAINLIEQSNPKGLARKYALAFVTDVDYRKIAFHMLKDNQKQVYEISVKNGVSTLFKSKSQFVDDVLDEFCIDAGYESHEDYMNQMELTDSPFNIKELT